jgi:hypothetical protein
MPIQVLTIARARVCARSLMTDLAHAWTIVHGHRVNDRIRARLFRVKEHILVRDTL